MSKKYYVFLFVVLLTALLVVSYSKVRYTYSDPFATLLVTESIITHKTIKLDYYGEEILQRYIWPNHWVVHQKNGHFYHYMPLGTAIASIPFVALANAWGFSMLESDASMQMVIAAFTAVITLIFLVKIALFFLTPPHAIILSGIFWFGTSFASTLGTALFSHNFAVLFALIAIYFSIKLSKSENSSHWAIISICIFFAYLCRPTMALLAVFVLLFLFTYNKMAALKSSILIAASLAVFIAFSLCEFNQVLPDYYMPERLDGEHFFVAIYGNIFSPARGLFIYSPFVLFAWLCFGESTRDFKLKNSWLLIGLAWPIMHLVLISRFPHWWAGGSYGPRFMVDILPGLFLLTIKTWPVNIRTWSTSFMSFLSKIGIVFLVVSTIFSIYVNSYQGLFNPYTALWNAEPNIDYNPGYLFDWEYPQFLHNQKRHESRLIQHSQKN